MQLLVGNSNPLLDMFHVFDIPSGRGESDDVDVAIPQPVEIIFTMYNYE